MRESRTTRFSAIELATSSFEVASLGGLIKIFSSAGTLRVGDPVIFSGVDGETVEVNTSAVSANFVSFAGIVVGGQQTTMTALLDDIDVGTLAANPGQLVMVMVSGIAYTTCEEIVTAPVVAMPGSVSRKIQTAVEVAGQVLGTILSDSIADGIVKLHINHR